MATMMMLMAMMMMLTLHHLVVGEVQVGEEEHVEQSQSPTEEEPGSLAHGPGQQRRNLQGGPRGKHVSPQLWGEEGLMGNAVLTMRSVDSPPTSSHRT